MLYLFGDETGNPGSDNCFCLGYLITKNAKPHIEKVREIRAKYGYDQREIKYSGSDYSQLLVAIDLIDYFFQAQDLSFKVLIKDREFFKISYYDRNRYSVRSEDLAYVLSYSELTRSIRLGDYNESEKFCIVDQKPQTAEGILSTFVSENDPSVVVFKQKGSSDLTNNGEYHGYSEMLQFVDLLTGIVGGLCSHKSGNYQNIYKKRFLTNIPDKQVELAKIHTNKCNFYYPRHPGLKINIWYWKPS